MVAGQLAIYCRGPQPTGSLWLIVRVATRNGGTFVGPFLVFPQLFQNLIRELPTDIGGWVNLRPLCQYSMIGARLRVGENRIELCLQGS
jgi:hypothetical protein